MRLRDRYLIRFGIVGSGTPGDEDKQRNGVVQTLAQKFFAPYDPALLSMHAYLSVMLPPRQGGRRRLREGDSLPAAYHTAFRRQALTANNSSGWPAGTHVLFAPPAAMPTVSLNSRFHLYLCVIPSSGIGSTPATSAALAFGACSSSFMNGKVSTSLML